MIFSFRVFIMFCFFLLHVGPHVRLVGSWVFAGFNNVSWDGLLSIAFDFDGYYAR